MILRIARNKWRYLELYSRKGIVLEAALDATDDLPIMANPDFEPTVDELSIVIDSLANNKATGQDCIYAEILKFGKPALLEKSHHLLSVCWRGGTISKVMKMLK